MAFYLVTSAHTRFGKKVPKSTSQAILNGQVLGWDVTAGQVIPLDNTSTFDEALFVSTEAVTAPAALSEVQLSKSMKTNSTSLILLTTQTQHTTVNE